MCHCLPIFVALLLTFCRKCVSQSQENSLVLPVPLNHQNEGGAEAQIGFKSQSEAEPFNKTVFVIPITGILLVITMVLLYIFYTWNLCRGDENKGARTKPRNEEQVCEMSFTYDEYLAKSFGDSPPSYIEATNPPDYLSSSALEYEAK